jgi:hypothetical protein
VIVGRFEQKIALELLEAEEFPVNFPDSWEFRCRDRFDSDCVRHHPFFMYLILLVLLGKSPTGAESGTHFCSRLIPIFRVEQIHCALGEPFLIGSLRV